MIDRLQILPRASVLEKLCASDRGKVLDAYMSALEDEIAGIQSGSVIVNHKGRAHQLSLARARMRRLVALAQSFGFWLEEKEAA